MVCKGSADDVLDAVAAAVADACDTCTTIRDWAAYVLRASDPDVKAAVTLKAKALWDCGQFSDILIGQRQSIDQPGRPSSVEVRAPWLMPKRGKGGTVANRAVMIHALVHVESVAIDLSWDILLRFDLPNGDQPPLDFFSDWLRIAAEEARHYTVLKERLAEEPYAMKYGDLPGHGGLWEDALETAGTLLGRLALEHCVHEARGLDVTRLQTIPRFRNNGDTQTAELLEGILEEEVTHSRDGLKWFKYVCQEVQGLDEAATIAAFHDTVRKHFKGVLKGPFNTADRARAGLTEEWYMPLTVDKDAQAEPSESAE